MREATKLQSPEAAQKPPDEKQRKTASRGHAAAQISGTAPFGAARVMIARQGISAIALPAATTAGSEKHGSSPSSPALQKRGEAEER